MKATKYTKETILNLGVIDRKFPDFQVGDTVSVMQKIKEGDKERLQAFQGDVIAIKRKGIASSFVVRKIAAGGVGVERIYPVFSPLIDSIKLIRKGRVRRAKLYYLRDRVGKAGRVEEQVISRKEKERALQQKTGSVE